MTSSQTQAHYTHYQSHNPGIWATSKPFHPLPVAPTHTPNLRPSTNELRVINKLINGRHARQSTAKQPDPLCEQDKVGVIRQEPQATEINADNITSTINEMIKDTNVLSAFELNEKNLQFLKELRRDFSDLRGLGKGGVV